MKIAIAKQYIRQFLLIINKYSFLPARNSEVPMIIIMFDNQMQHGGLLDRIKGIITAKLIADELQYHFGIYVDKASFDLFKFLKPRNNIFKVDENQMVYNIWTSRPVIYYNRFKIDKASILKLFRKRKQQYHFYCNTDLLRYFYSDLSQSELNKRWRVYFHELFYFTEYFDVVYKQSFYSKNVIGIHLRFQFLLGDGEENTLMLDNTAKEELIKDCICSVNKIISDNYGFQFLIASDSTFFLNAFKIVKDINSLGIIISKGTVGHIDFVHTEAVLEKALTDFYLLSKCTSVYQILGKHMYNSQFSKYAAILGNADYHLVKI